MSRFRMAILLALVAVAALPTSAHARRIPYCHLFSPEAVGRAVDYRGIRVVGQIAGAPSLTKAPLGRMAVCDFWSGQDQVAESSVMTFSTAADTALQFKRQLETRKGTHVRRVTGPWRRAYMVGNSQITVLKGRHIFDLEYRVQTTKATSRGLLRIAAQAARKL